MKRRYLLFGAVSALSAGTFVSMTQLQGTEFAILGDKIDIVRDQFEDAEWTPADEFTDGIEFQW
jgi:hypothetical protein